MYVYFGSIVTIDPQMNRSRGTTLDQLAEIILVGRWEGGGGSNKFYAVEISLLFMMQLNYKYVLGPHSDHYVIRETLQ